MLHCSDRFYGDDQAQLSCHRPQGVQIDLLPTWHLNGTTLDITQSRKYSVNTAGTSLTIFNIQYSDEGNYTCQFRQNAEVLVSQACTLRVVGKS